GGIVSVRLKGGFEAAKRLCERTRLFTLAESLGGVESLVNHPAVMTHASIPEATRARLGIGPELVRLSVGVEALEDLRADLASALSGAAPRTSRRPPPATSHHRRPPGCRGTRPPACATPSSGCSRAGSTSWSPPAVPTLARSGC